MKCPTCKQETAVIKTIKLDEVAVLRIRYCKKCNRAWNSTEKYDDQKNDTVYMAAGIK